MDAGRSFREGEMAGSWTWTLTSN